MEYLIVDSGVPKPNGKSIWSPIIENATAFSCVNDADVQKDAVEEATDIIRLNDKWFVVRR